MTTNINDLPNEMLMKIFESIPVELGSAMQVSQLWNQLSMEVHRDFIRPIHTAIVLSGLGEGIKFPEEFKNIPDIFKYFQQLFPDTEKVIAVSVELLKKNELVVIKNFLQALLNSPEKQTDLLVAVCKQLYGAKEFSLASKAASIIPIKEMKDEMLAIISEEFVLPSYPR